jgi:membrane protein YdbS with pleckstrin-like domain
MVTGQDCCGYAERAGAVTDAGHIGGESPAARPRPAGSRSAPGQAGSAVAGPPGAEIQWRRPSPRLLSARRLQAALVTVPAALVAGLCFGLAGSLAAGLAAGLGMVVIGLLGERFLARRVAAWGYAERDDDLMVRRGVLIRRQSVIPYGRMQFIDVTAGPVERSLGLATVRMHTAAAASDARIPGLDRADAARLRDQLAAIGEAQAAGL